MIAGLSYYRNIVNYHALLKEFPTDYPDIRYLIIVYDFGGPITNLEIHDFEVDQCIIFYKNGEDVEKQGEFNKRCKDFFKYFEIDDIKHLTIEDSELVKEIKKLILS